MNESDPVYSKQAIEMFTVANEYCIFIEKATNYGKDDLFNYLEKVLPLLYLKGAMVPEIIAEYPEANERYVTEEQWQDVFNELRNIFDKDDVFFFSDPLSGQDELQRMSLSENLADLYQDMKDFVLLYSKELYAAQENAVQEISRLFKSHWGHKVLQCQVSIHFLRHGQNIAEGLEIF